MGLFLPCRGDRTIKCSGCLPRSAVDLLTAGPPHPAAPLSDRVSKNPEGTRVSATTAQTFPSTRCWRATGVTGDYYRRSCCCPKRPGHLHVQIRSPRPWPHAIDFIRNSIEVSVCCVRRKPPASSPRPPPIPPPPQVPKVPKCVYALAHYMHKLHQKAFVYTLFIHFQRVKQPIYWAVNNPRPKS